MRETNRCTLLDILIAAAVPPNTGVEWDCCISYMPVAFVWKRNPYWPGLRTAWQRVSWEGDGSYIVLSATIMKSLFLGEFFVFFLLKKNKAQPRSRNSSDLRAPNLTDWISNSNSPSMCCCVACRSPGRSVRGPWAYPMRERIGSHSIWRSNEAGQIRGKLQPNSFKLVWLQIARAESSCLFLLSIRKRAGRCSDVSLA